MPIWVGGRTARSLRRAVELGRRLGAVPGRPDDVRSMLDQARAPGVDRAHQPLDVALWPEPALDLLGEPDRIRRQADEHVGAGATILNYRFPSESLAHHLEQMEALTELLDFGWET